MSYIASCAAFSTPAGGYYFRDVETKPTKQHKKTESASNLIPQINTPPTSDKEVNPMAFAMASIYNRSHPNSRVNSPAPSRPASIHRETEEEKALNPYAYAMGSIYRRSHSRSRSATPAASRAASVHADEKEINPYAYAMGSIWRRSHPNSAATTPASSRRASVTAN